MEYVLLPKNHDSVKADTKSADLRHVPLTTADPRNFEELCATHDDPLNRIIVSTDAGDAS